MSTTIYPRDEPTGVMVQQAQKTQGSRNSDKDSRKIRTDQTSFLDIEPF